MALCSEVEEAICRELKAGRQNRGQLEGQAYALSARHMWMRTPPVHAAHLQTQMDSQRHDMMMTRVAEFYIRRQACFGGGRLCYSM